MKVLVYPADEFGCGYHRMIWPAASAARAGCDVEVIEQSKRKVEFVLKGHEVIDVKMPDDVDVIVFQRVTHHYLVQAVRLLRDRGIAVVIDVDDDLTLIHPLNPAFGKLHPKNFRHLDDEGGLQLHSWRHLVDACQAATLVTVSTPELLARYAGHGRGRVLPNYLSEIYYGLDHEDSTQIVWPASIHSHPNDPEAAGNAIARVVHDGAEFVSYGQPEATARAFGLRGPVHDDPEYVGIMDWPAAIVRHGIGIAPLADTRFNAGKSWLKPLELAAVGVPWIGSPRAEYRRLHAMGCGILAEKPKQWYRELTSLLHDSVRRNELSDAGRVVADELRLEKHGWRWQEAWSDALAIERS